MSRSNQNDSNPNKFFKIQSYYTSIPMNPSAGIQLKDYLP